MKKTSIITIIMVLLQPGCATNQANTPLYTANEKSKLSYCIGMTDTAWYIANQKKKQVPAEKLVQRYENKDNGRLHIATVKKVYRDQFDNVWKYTVSFFKTCANKIAMLPPHRTGMAAYCMQNQLIARITHGFKTSGASKQRAYQYFRQFKSQTVRDIIDQVYTGNKNRADTQLEVWHSCIGSL